jgi:hypothetical protein
MLSKSLKVLSAALSLAACCGLAQGQIKISQVYGGGGAVSGVYNADYVELFNSGSSPITMSGWSLQGTTLTGSSWTRQNLPASVTLQPGQYYLMRLQTESTTSGTPILPAPDAIIGTSSSSPIFTDLGAVALMSNTTTITSGTCPIGSGALVDYINFRGPTSNPTVICNEGGPLITPNEQTIAQWRKDGGCTDTDNNPNDWFLAPPSPHSSIFNGFLSASFSSPVIIENTGPTLTISVSRSSVACNSLTALTTVTANLSALGGSSSQALSDNGSGVFTATIAVNPSLATGLYFIPVTATTATASVNSVAPLRVKVAPPNNDTCATAELLTSGGFSATVDNRGAENDVDTGTCALNGFTGAGVWYVYTPTVNEILSVVDSSTQDINWGVFTGSCGTLTNVACISAEGTEATPANRYRINAGTTYYILIGHQYGYAPTVPMQLAVSTVAAPSAPSNDACATATPITLPYGASINAEGALDSPQVSTCGASNGQTNGRYDTWYSFTLATPGRLSLLETTPNTPAYALYSGSCGSLTEVGCATGTSAAIIVNTPGTYLLQVFQSNTGVAPNGDFILNFTFDPFPANDNCAGATDLATVPGFPALTRITQDWTAANDDAGTTCNTTSTILGHGVWYKYTAPTGGTLFLSSDPSSSTTVAAWYDSCGGPQVGCYGTETKYLQMTAGQTIYLAFGDWIKQTGATINPLVLDVQFIAQSPNTSCETAFDLNAVSMPYTNQFDQSGGGDLAGFPCTAASSPVARKALYFKYTSPINGRMRLSDAQGTQNVDFRIYSAPSSNPCDNLVEHACVSDANDRGSFTITAGTTYYIIAADSGASATGPAPYNLTFEPVASPVTNDTCNTAQVITSLPFGPQTISDIVYIGDDADVSCNNSSASAVWHGVWYSFTPSSNMAVSLSDSNSSTNTVIAAYTNCNGAPLACRTPEDAYFELTAGATYYFLVGYDSSTPLFVVPSTNAYSLTLRQVDSLRNDICANATQIGTTTFNSTINIAEATADAPGGGAPSGTGCNPAASTQMRNSVWYKFVVTGSGSLTGTINPDVGSSVDGVYALYSSADGTCNSLTQVGCGGNPEPIAVNQSLTAGTTYYMQVGIFGTTTAAGVTSISLNFSGTLAPACVADFDQNGNRNIDDIFIFLNAWFQGCNGTQPGDPCFNRSVDVDNSNTINIDDIFIFINRWFAGC